MEYVFDIRRTSREVLDHARRKLYKPEAENCGQMDQQSMDTQENINCDTEDNQAKKCQVGNLTLRSKCIVSGHQISVYICI